LITLLNYVECAWMSFISKKIFIFQYIIVLDYEYMVYLFYKTKRWQIFYIVNIWIKFEMHEYIICDMKYDVDIIIFRKNKYCIKMYKEYIEFEICTNELF